MTLKILNSVLSMDEYGYTSADTLLLQIKSQCASYVFFTEFCVEKDLCPHSRDKFKTQSDRFYVGKVIF